MATNVTTDTIKFLNQKMIVKRIELDKRIETIRHYNEEVVPLKNKNAIETLESRKAKRAARPEKYVNKAPLPEVARVYEPVDFEQSDAIGLIKAMEAYQYAIYCITRTNKPEMSGRFTINDYLAYFNKTLKTWELRAFHAKKRLDKNRIKLAKNKQLNPKKYAKRPDLPEVNAEIINAQRCVDHYKKAIEAIEKLDSKKRIISVTSPTGTIYHR